MNQKQEMLRLLLLAKVTCSGLSSIQELCLEMLDGFQQLISG